MRCSAAVTLASATASLELSCRSRCAACRLSLFALLTLLACVHIVAGLAIYARSTLAQTGVSGPVVVDGESFLDALFASAGQG